MIIESADANLSNINASEITNSFLPCIFVGHSVNRDNYFKVGERVRFLFTSCERSLWSEHSERVSLAILHNE